MTVSGNSVFGIPDGATTTSVTDATDFGTAYDNGGNVSETYTITNISATATLDLSSPFVTVVPTSTLTGFSVTAEPGSDALAPGDSTTFTVEFAPTAVGSATAEVEITSNDAANASPFKFAISGASLAPSSAMDVQGNGQTISYGESTPSTSNDTAFGTVLDNGATASQTFTILSDGHNLPLNITSVLVQTVSGNGGFTISAAPGSSSVAAGGSTTFTVQFAPTGPGLVVANVEIVSSDSSHPNPFVFQISGMGVNPPPTVVSEIDDSNSTGFSLSGSWSTYSAGLNGSEHYAAAGTGTSQANYTFTGLTPGQYEILGTWSPMPSGASNAPYTFYDGGRPVGAALANQSVAPNGSVVAGWQILGIVNITSTTLRVSLTNNANGAVIADGVEIGPLTGVTLKFPQLSVSDNLTSIASNATPMLANGTDFGTVANNSGGTLHTFTLTNNGLATLTFGSTPVRAVGAAYSIVGQPSVSSLAPGASTTFQVKFSPTANGLQTGSVAISINDPNFPEPHLELFLQGTEARPRQAARRQSSGSELLAME